MESESPGSRSALQLLAQISRGCRELPSANEALAHVRALTAEHFAGRCFVFLRPDEAPFGSAEATLAAEVHRDRSSRQVCHEDQVICAAPLLAQRGVLGVLLVVRHSPFAPDELLLLEEVAARAAGAVHAARLVEELETERRRLHTLNASVAEREREAATLRYTAHQLRVIADALPALVSYVGRDYRYHYVNRAYGGWFGRPVDQIIGRRVEEVLGAEAAERVVPHLAAALAGDRVSYQSELAGPDGPTRYTTVDYVPHRTADGAVRGVVVLVCEVTEARRAEERAGFLADASRVLSSSLDVDAALRALAEVAVPRIADLCVIEVPGEGGVRVPHTVHAADPALEERVRTYMRRWPSDSASGPPRAVRTGDQTLVPRVTDAMMVAGAVDDEHLAAIRDLQIASMLVVPVPTSRGPYAALTLSATRRRRPLDEADFELAKEIAARTGLAIDNARLLREAREADRAKDEFLAMLAHELRNPLATIMTGLELVGELGVPTPTARRTLVSVERQTTKLARLVDDLLDVSRITRGKIELRREGCVLDTVIGRAVDAARPLIDTRGLTLTVDVPEGIAMVADPVRIEQVFANLLNNAAKYTEPGGHVRIEARTNGNVVRIEVTDDGIGIQEDVLPYVFQPFRQGAVGLDRSYGGLGLGLTLVEWVVAMHGGTVEAASGGTGQGSTFTVCLPVADCLVEPRSVTSRPVPVSEARRVLIVDDNTDAAVATAELLTVLGHAVEVAHDGPMALQIAGRTSPEVILLDLGLPGMDGFEVAHRLRADGNRSRIVALSGYGREQDRRASHDAGFDRHLIKPVSVQVLLSAIADG